MNRRRVLIGSASAIAVSVGPAGCLEKRSGSTPTPTTTSPETTPTQTKTPTGTLDQLSFDATVTTDASQRTPAMITTTLTNTEEAPVRVGTGPTPVFRAPDNAFKHGILLYPETEIGPNKTPDEPTDGCWRYIDDEFLVQDSLNYQTVTAGAAISETHRVYTVGEDRSCLPEGESVFSAEVVGTNDSPTLALHVTLTVDTEEQLAVTADTTRQ